MAVQGGLKGRRIKGLILHPPGCVSGGDMC